MNMQNLISQLKMAQDPTAMILSMLNPQQKQQANQFLKKPKKEQCEEIARVCNEQGITKEQLNELIRALK